MPSSAAARATRIAISPRLAMSSFNVVLPEDRQRFAVIGPTRRRAHRSSKPTHAARRAPGAVRGGASPGEATRRNAGWGRRGGTSGWGHRAGDVGPGRGTRQ
jgi:hypothetical protein